METSRPYTTLRYWLLSCMGMVALMVFVGGVTRLTESGLSIVEWKLFDGILPPMNHAQWLAYFEEYKTSPEFQKINSSFGLAEFQRIFWLEYIHRVLGRITGLVFLLPLIALAITRRIPKAVAWKMFGIGLLVAAQGVVGWFMVASGLIDDPKVSPLKLSMHLTLAFTIFALTLWVYLQQFHAALARHAQGWRYWVPRTLIALTFVQIILGAWVAGWDAGLTYNTWPLMDGAFIPSGMYPYAGFWNNTTSYIPLIQLQHRLGAIVLFAAYAAYIAFAWRSADATERRMLGAVAAVITLQFALGVATLLSVVQIALASAHQMAALLLLSAIILISFRFSRIR